MRDPYLYEDVNVLKNLGNIRNAEELRRAEGDITKHTIPMVYAQRFSKFNAETLCEIHRIIFDTLYEWAGSFRTIPVIKREDILGGDTVRYTHPSQIKIEISEAIKEISKLKKNEPKEDLLFKLVRITAKLWQTHPFRDGNTRAIISFIALLAAHLNIEIDYSLFEKHASYVRNALVWASQGIYSKHEYLERIFFDAANLVHTTYNPDLSTTNDYSQIEGYNIADYVEQPHIYVDE